MKLASLLVQPAAPPVPRDADVDDRGFFESWVPHESPESDPLPTKAKSKKVATPVRELPELITHFAQLLPEDPDLRWSFPETPATDPIPLLELDVEGHTQAFTPVYELRPSQARLGKIRVPVGSPPPLLLTTELTARMLDTCRQRRLSVLDLNGRALLRAPGLLVDRAALPGHAFKFEVEPRNIFAGKSARILRTLLTDATCLWSQREVVARTQASAGLVSRIAQYLITQGFAVRAEQRDLQVQHLPRLLDAWAASDNFEARTRSVHFATEERSPLEVAHTLRAWAKSRNVQIAFTRQFAAGLRHPEGAPSESPDDSVSAYLSVMPDAAALEQMDLRSEDESAPASGGLWLYVPDDEGLFLETQPSYRFVGILQQHLNLDLPLVSDAQIYLDLLKSTPQGIEQARKLRAWERFCTVGAKA
ncbi:MAG: hypothetical protein ACAH88_11700 [Roseimicrobium sp.]